MTPPDPADLSADIDQDASARPPTPPLDPKPWWTSRGIWGAVGVIVAQIARGIGYEVDAGMLAEGLFNIATLLCAVVALVGRWRATRPIAVR